MKQLQACHEPTYALLRIDYPLSDMAGQPTAVTQIGSYTHAYLLLGSAESVSCQDINDNVIAAAAAAVGVRCYCRCWQPMALGQGQILIAAPWLML